MTISECIAVISCIIAVFSFLFAVKNNKRTDTKDIEERVKENTRINTKLDGIGQDTREIKTEISEMRKSINSHDNKITKLEESCKSAHHRLDTLENRFNGKDGKE